MTGLIGGTRVKKSDLRVESYGNVDELNAHIGLLRDLLQEKKIASVLPDIQERLFVIGAALACDPAKEPKFAMPDLLESDVAFLETAIDQLNLDLPKMTHFILPGGHPCISQAHITRCVCRRAERSCVALLTVKDKTDQPEQSQQRIIQYLNRLSDYLFVLGRSIGQQLSVPEIRWVPRTT